jgi:16S rRNA processing protein RimM
MSDTILVAAIAGAFGVQGLVRLKSFTADPEAVAEYGPLFTEDGSGQFNITLVQTIKNGFAAKLSGVATKEQADALRGTQLFAPRDRLPALPDDEFYHADLIGLSAFDAGGQALGKIKAIQNHGAGDLLEVEPGKGKQSVLVPFTLAIVPTVDLASGRVIIDAPDGLFD